MTRALAISLLASAGVLVLGAGLPGCGEPPADGLVVSLQTDFVPVAEFDYIRASVDGAHVVDVDVSVGDSFARPRHVTAYHDVPDGRRMVAVALLRGDRVLVSRRVQVDLHGSHLVNVVLARSCADVVCGDNETCVAGECVPPSCITGSEPGCPRPECTRGQDCESTTSCVAPTCAAGICLESGDDDACAAGEVCVPAIGCIARPRDDDGGVAPPDGGEPLDALGAPDALQSIDASLDAPGCTPASCVAGPCETAMCVGDRCERASTCAGGEMCCSGVCALDCSMVTCAGRPMGFECRPSAGVCDPAETCDGWVQFSS